MDARDRPRLPDAVAAVPSSIDTRAWVEERVQSAEQMAAALAGQGLLASPERLEGRIQDAETLACAYAEQGLRVQGSALAAMGRRLADLERRNRDLVADRAALEARLSACEALIERLRARIGLPVDP